MRRAQTPSAGIPLQCGWQASRGAVPRGNGVVSRTLETPRDGGQSRHAHLRPDSRRPPELPGQRAADAGGGRLLGGRRGRDAARRDRRRPGARARPGPARRAAARHRRLRGRERLDAAGDCPAIVLTSSRESSDFGAAVAESPARGFVTKGELSGESTRGADRMTSLRRALIALGVPRLRRRRRFGGADPDQRPRQARADWPRR